MCVKTLLIKTAGFESFKFTQTKTFFIDRQTDVDKRTHFQIVLITTADHEICITITRLLSILKMYGCT